MGRDKDDFFGRKGGPQRRLLLLRHAKSAWNEAPAHDKNRALAPRGRRAAAAMGVYLRDEGLAPDYVLCSAAKRAVQTWEAIAIYLPAPIKLVKDAKLYLAPPSVLLPRLHRAPDEARTVMMIGHEGGIDELALQLVAPPNDDNLDALRRLNLKFPTGALAVIEFDAEHWADVGAATGQLVTFLGPKDLV
ncbi:MAG: histidine phosphatase family protein [Alphaproteobacteria bacterium]